MPDMSNYSGNPIPGTISPYMMQMLAQLVQSWRNGTDPNKDWANSQSSSGIQPIPNASPNQPPPAAIPNATPGQPQLTPLQQILQGQLQQGVNGAQAPDPSTLAGWNGQVSPPVAQPQNPLAGMQPQLPQSYNAAHPTFWQRFLQGMRSGSGANSPLGQSNGRPQGSLAQQTVGGMRPGQSGATSAAASAGTSALSGMLSGMSPQQLQQMIMLLLQRGTVQ